MNEDREQLVSVSPPKTSGVSRRGFLGGMAAVSASSAFNRLFGIRGLAPIEETDSSKEKEPSPFRPALVVDFSPSSDKLKELQEKGEITQNTTPFDLDAFFVKHIGQDFRQQLASWAVLARDEYPDEPDEFGLIKTLFKNGKEREAVIVSLAFLWKDQGENVGDCARKFRYNETNKSVEVVQYPEGMDEEKYMKAMAEGTYTFQDLANLPKETKKIGKDIPLQPYEIFAIQPYIQSIEKSEVQDEFGNPYYDLVIDHIRLAHDLSEKCKDDLQRVICISQTIGSRIRVGRQLPIDYLPQFKEDMVSNNPEAWAGNQNDNKPDETEDKDGKTWGKYLSSPALAIETGYTEWESLQALSEIARAIPDTTVVAAAGDSRGEIPSLDLPENCILVAAFDPFKMDNKVGPSADLYGHSTQLYYLYLEKLNLSPFAAAQVAEWLVQQELLTPKQANQRLREHARLYKARNGDCQVLDFSYNLAAVAGWDDPTVFRPVATE